VLPVDGPVNEQSDCRVPFEVLTTRYDAHFANAMKAFFAAFSFLSALPLAFGQASEPTVKVDVKALIALSEFTNSVGMAMVKATPTLWAGKYPVTQAEYSRVAGSNPSHFSGARNPVDSVSYNEASRFCEELTVKEGKEDMLPEGFAYTLPTQAEWQMLMDAATLNDAITSQKGDRTGTAPVGSLRPNALGLYDTRGNVWEFCLDPQDKPYRVLRGGAWNSFIEINLRPEFRWYATGPDDRKDTYGFRVVLRPSAK
jgi:hypothetical protein